MLEAPIRRISPVSMGEDFSIYVSVIHIRVVSYSIFQILDPHILNFCQNFSFTNIFQNSGYHSRPFMPNFQLQTWIIDVVGGFAWFAIRLNFGHFFLFCLEIFWSEKEEN